MILVVILYGMTDLCNFPLVFHNILYSVVLVHGARTESLVSSCEKSRCATRHLKYKKERVFNCYDLNINDSKLYFPQYRLDVCEMISDIIWN